MVYHLDQKHFYDYIKQSNGLLVNILQYVDDIMINCRPICQLHWLVSEKSVYVEAAALTHIHSSLLGNIIEAGFSYFVIEALINDLFWLAPTCCMIVHLFPNLFQENLLFQNCLTWKKQDVFDLKNYYNPSLKSFTV